MGLLAHADLIRSIIAVPRIYVTFQDWPNDEPSKAKAAPYDEEVKHGLISLPRVASLGKLESIKARVASLEIVG